MNCNTGGGRKLPVDGTAPQPTATAPTVDPPIDRI